MEKFILFALSTIGLVTITNLSSLFKPIREFVSLWAVTVPGFLSWFFNSILSCSYCMGVWVGLFISTAIYGLSPVIALYGFSGSFLAGFAVTIIQYFNRKN